MDRQHHAFAHHLTFFILSVFALVAIAQSGVVHADASYNYYYVATQTTYPTLQEAENAMHTDPTDPVLAYEELERIDLNQPQPGQITRNYHIVPRGPETTIQWSY